VRTFMGICLLAPDPAFRANIKNIFLKYNIKVQSSYNKIPECSLAIISLRNQSDLTDYETDYVAKLYMSRIPTIFILKGQLSDIVQNFLSRFEFNDFLSYEELSFLLNDRRFMDLLAEYDSLIELEKDENPKQNISNEALKKALDKYLTFVR
jgi:hypothetical protein